MYNTDGKVVWSAELDAYGDVWELTGERTDCPFRFQGQYEDRETGLYYNRFRYYSAEEGMYISQDPIKLEGGINLYSYVHNCNRWIDPLGLSESCSDKMTKEEAFRKSQNALEEEIQKVNGLSNKKKSEILTMVGATSIETGETTVGVKKRGENMGMCAEDIAAQKLGGDSSQIVFTEAYRPRTEETVPVCTRCQTKYNKDQFPEGTKFEQV